MEAIFLIRQLMERYREQKETGLEEEASLAVAPVNARDALVYALC